MRRLSSHSCRPTPHRSDNRGVAQRSVIEPSCDVAGRPDSAPSLLTMSITSTATESFDRGTDRGGELDESVFDQVAFHNPEVCSRCFARIREVEDLDVQDAPDCWDETDRRRSDDGVHGWIWFGDDDTSRVHEPRTYCRECGSRSGRADDQALSKRETLANCARLHERLVEAGYDSELYELKRRVRVAKSRPKYEAFDTEIMRWAVAKMLAAMEDA